MLIINVGMPRSGTLWRYKIIRDLVIAAGGEDGLEIRKKYLLSPFINLPNADLNTTKMKRLLPAAIPSILGKTYVLNSHAEPTNFANLLLKNGRMKVIYGFRDPRDCILSILEYSKRALPQYSNEFLKIHTVEEAAIYMQKYINIWEDWTSCDEAHVIQYEYMLSDYYGEINKIIQYLGINIPDRKLNDILNDYLPQIKPSKEVKTHFQHGKVNRFREKFNDKELQFLNSNFQDILNVMHYEI